MRFSAEAVWSSVSIGPDNFADAQSGILLHGNFETAFSGGGEERSSYNPGPRLWRRSWVGQLVSNDISHLNLQRRNKTHSNCNAFTFESSGARPTAVTCSSNVKNQQAFCRLRQAG